MNANELADELDVESSQAEYGYVVDNWNLFTEAANMLRQLQAENEALKDIVERLIANWSDDFKNFKYASDEPEENRLRADVFVILRKAQEK